MNAMFVLPCHLFFHLFSIPEFAEMQKFQPENVLLLHDYVANLLPHLQTANGNVEAKVVCLFRRRDISSNLNTLADSNASE